MAHGQPIRVLLLEDSPAFAYLICEYLSGDYGGSYTVVHVELLRDALASLARRHYDIILMDQSLPDSDPQDTLPAIHAAAGNTPVLVLSGSPVGADVDEKRRQLARGFLSKRDATPGLLTTTIEEVLGRVVAEKKSP